MHPYFDAYKDDESIIEAPEQFDWSWDNFEPTKELLQGMVFDESLQYHAEDEP
jgi:mitogen-activated protein kinase 1/3